MGPTCFNMLLQSHPIRPEQMATLGIDMDADRFAGADGLLVFQRDRQCLAAMQRDVEDRLAAEVFDKIDTGIAERYAAITDVQMFRPAPVTTTLRFSNSFG